MSDEHSVPVRAMQESVPKSPCWAAPVWGALGGPGRLIKNGKRRAHGRALGLLSVCSMDEIILNRMQSVLGAMLCDAMQLTWSEVKPLDAMRSS